MITDQELEQIADILKFRANELAKYSMSHRESADYSDAVSHAISREIARLRDLEDKIRPEHE